MFAAFFVGSQVSRSFTTCARTWGPLAALLFVVSVPALSQAQVLGQRMPYMNGPNPPQQPNNQSPTQQYNQQQWLAYLAQQQALQTQMLKPAISAPAAQPTIKEDYVVTVAFVMMHDDGRMTTVRREFHTNRRNPSTGGWEQLPNVHQNLENVKSNLTTNGWRIVDSYRDSEGSRHGNW
jgi:hypothetical protein